MDASSTGIWTSKASILPSQYVSTLLPSPHSSTSATAPSDTLAAISRQVAYVQRELQSLLDAQSVGLLAGLGHDPQPSQSSAQSSKQGSRKLSIRTPSRSLLPPGPIHLPPSPTRSSRERNSATEAPNTAPTKSLNTARWSIHKALLQLSELKGSEAAALGLQQDSTAEFLSSLEALAAKKKGIEDAIKDIEAGEESAGSTTTNGEGRKRRISIRHSTINSSSALADEETSLTSEIHSMETRLYELRARLAHVRRLRQEKGNKLAARLSSWKGALADVDKTIQRKVLEGRGLEDLYAALRNGGRKRKKDGQQDGVWALPRERRTVDLVKEEVDRKAEGLTGRREEVEREEKACMEGADVWKSVVEKVKGVEGRMRDELRKLGDTQVSVMGSDGGKEGMLAILELMDRTIGELKEEVTVAGGKGWNLLVCAVGAELEALRQGREMLQAALSGKDPLDADGHGLEEPEASMMTARSRFSDQRRRAVGTEGRENDDGAAEEGSNPLVDFNDDGRRDVADSVSAVEMQSFNRPAERYRDEEDDDEPGPDLLVEQVSE